MQETLDPSTRASVVFTRLKDLPPDGRARILEAECGDDRLLRKEIEELLEAADRDLVAVARTPTPEAMPAVGPPRRPTPGPALASGALATQALRPGALIAGRYRLIRKIGSGGLSVVYLALQEEPVQREIALKLLAPGLHTESVTARFEGERNALSRMSHPYVAQIHDAGSTELGQAFVAMEFIDGLPIDQYCSEHGLDLTQRLTLFLKVCRGVAHAHQKGIIHRDLKPTNILVVTHEGEAVPKVIDFGIAKSVTGSLTSGPNATRIGYVVGTPGYMSPEQAAAGEVDTTTDVYALGVLLYELLTGSLPYTPPDPGHLEMHAWHQRLVTTRPEPMSQRLRSFGLGRADGQRARPPGLIEPQALVGDLDLIAQKALAAEPDHRYRTVSELATDIERTLTGEPILARPPSIRYLLGRMARRHRGAVVAGALALVGVIVATVVIMRLVAANRVADEEVVHARERARTEERHAAERITAAERTRARGSVAAAQAAVQARNTAAARRNLDAVPVDLRDWEWRWLAYTTDQSELVLRGHRAPVKALALTADEALVASLDEQGALRLWDARDGATLGALDTGLTAPGDDTAGLALSLAHGIVVGSDQRARMCAWDLVTWLPRWCRVGAFGFGADSLEPDGELVVGTPTGVEIVALETGATLARLDAPAGTAQALWAHPPGGERLVLAFGSDAIIALALPEGADAAGAATRGAVRWRRQGTIAALAPGAALAVVMRWGALDTRELVDVASGEVVDVVKSRGTGFGALLVDGRGEIASIEQGLAVSIRGHARAVPSGDFLGHRAAITASRAGRDTFWFGDASGDVRRWSSAIAPAPSRVARSNDNLFAGAVTPRGDVAFSSGWGMVKAWSVATGAELWSRWLGREYLPTLAASQREVVVGDGAGRLVWLDVADGTPTHQTDAVGTAITAVVMRADRALAGTVDGEVAAYDRRAQEIVWRTPTHRGPIGALALHPGGRWLAVAGGHSAKLPHRLNRPWPDRRDGRVDLVDLDSGERARTLPTHGADGWLSLVFSPDGTQLVGGGADGTFTLWTLDRPSVVRMPSLGLEVRAVAFGPDGQRLFVGDEHGTIQIWAMPEVEHLATLPGVPGAILRLAIAPDADTLVAMSMTHPLTVFDPRPAGPAREARQAAWARRARLRARLDELGERLGGTRATLDAIAADPAQAALGPELAAMARARGDNPNQLNSWAWGMLRYPGEPPERVALARARAEVCAGGWPIWEFHNTLAVARLRDGDARGAIAAAQRSVQLASERGITTFPTEWAVVAIAAVRLGDRATAEAALAQAKKDLAEPPWDTDGEARSIVDEARAALAQ